MEDVHLNTRLGPVRGVRGAGVCAFLGMPYGHVRERFRYAEPEKPRTALTDATRYGPRCPQFTRSRDRMAEDCLSVNVWTPAADGRARPVFLFVHGGSFSSGAGSAPDLNGADLAAAGDCVVVTCNYRLGAFGFVDFSAHDGSCDPNCGLDDVLLALHWVYENIADYGGDPANITMGGQSAGATLCSALPVVDPKRQYARRAILMSAGPTLISSREGGSESAQAFLEMSGRTPDALRRMPPEELLALQRRYAGVSGLGAGTYMPTVDGTLLPSFPIAAAAGRQCSALPMLIGTTKEEMSFLFVPPVARALEISGIFDAGVDAEPEEVRERIARGYDRYGRRGPSIMMSDLVFRMGSVWLAEAMSAHADIWMYRFDYETPAMKVSNLHAFHSSDIPFLFGNYREGYAPLMFCFSPSKRKIRAVTRQMRGDFLQFIRGRQLAWQRCSGEDTPAKCYEVESFVEPCVHPEVKENYKGSNFRARSFAGRSNTLRAPNSAARDAS